MFSSQLKQFIRLERLLSGAMGMLLGLLLSIASDWLVQQQRIQLIWLLIAGMFVLVVIWLVFRLRHPFKDIDVAIQTPLILRDEAEYRRAARRGFVGFTPRYRPLHGSSSAQLQPDELKKAIENHQYEQLDIEHSNLFPTIQAITTHASKLEHCWLITTESEKPEESTQSTAKLLEKYLKTHKKLTCKFHTYYNIRLDDDGQILNKTYDCVKSIFNQASRMNIKPQDMIVDFTTGTRSMTLGMILASLNGDRNIEFMGTHYDERGHPKTDDVFPIIFSFEPNVNSD